MANRDGTGPLGQGAKTGKKQGNCNNNSSNTGNQTVFGRFRKWCRGMGKRGGVGQGLGNGNRQNND